MGGLENKTLRLTFYLTEDAVYRWMNSHDIAELTCPKNPARRIANDEVVNAEVRALVKHRSSEDGQTVYEGLKICGEKSQLLTRRPMETTKPW